MRQHYQKELESRLVIPTLQFLHRERSSGIVLGIFVLLALVLANSPFREAYTHFLEHHFGFSINGQTYLDFSLEHWINDGLMSMFFFAVGLELKREFIGGELRDLRWCSHFARLGNTHGHRYSLCFGRASALG